MSWTAKQKAADKGDAAELRRLLAQEGTADLEEGDQVRATPAAAAIAAADAAAAEPFAAAETRLPPWPLP